MGRKSSAKAQARPTPPGQGPAEPRRSRTPLLVLAVVAIAIVGVVAYTLRGDNGAPTEQTAAQTVAPVIVDPPASAALGPHPQEHLPPLPFDSGPPVRPPDVVRAVYKFAAEHPEVLSYVPCYCGCEHQGHRGNDDCFVAGRNAKGDVTQWEPHGMT
jgi:hypothetical protein